MSFTKYFFILLFSIVAQARDCVPITFLHIDANLFPTPKKNTFGDWAKAFKTTEEGTSFSNISAAVKSLRPDLVLRVSYTLAWDGGEIGDFKKLRKFEESLPRDEDDYLCNVNYIWIGILPPDIAKQYAVDNVNSEVHCCLLTFNADGSFVLYLQAEAGGTILPVSVIETEFTKRTFLLLSVTTVATQQKA